jgi:hypothetical protein
MTQAWHGYALDELKRLSASLHLASLLPPVKRVRRRGFRRDIRRGDDVLLANGEPWRVVRRSPWHLWVEPIPPFEARVGQTITVRLPARFQPEAGA